MDRDAIAQALANSDYSPSGANLPPSGNAEVYQVDYLRADAVLAAAAQVQPAPRTVTVEEYEAARQVLAMSLLLPRTALDAVLAALGITVMNRSDD